MNPSRASTFHLFFDFSAASAAERTSQAVALSDATSSLPVPDEVSFLQALRDAPRLSTAPQESMTEAVVLEPVTLRDGQPRLLLLNPASNRLRVNEGPAPRLSLLRERDQFQFDDSCVFHVTIFHRPQTGPVPPDKIGKPCPICLAALSDDPTSICYQCPCGVVLHLQDPSGLDCARAVRVCPSCHQSISFAAGYAWVPEVDL